jgi:predicted O-methyltransferase YrrM
MSVRSRLLRWKSRGAADSDLALPDAESLVEDLVRLSHRSDAIARYLKAVDAGFYTHPDGRRESLSVALRPPQAGLLAYLAQRCPVPLSVETGFGMGMSATVILGARNLGGSAFEHIAFDPFAEHGKVVQSWLEAEFGNRFRRHVERSESGLGRLLGERGAKSAGLAFIDGGHQFETVMTDFRLADLLCCEGGYIVFDDVLLPAIETAINYIRANRPDYALAHLPVGNTTILQKRARDQRQWSSFKPFRVPRRKDWNAARGG